MPDKSAYELIIDSDEMCVLSEYEHLDLPRGKVQTEAELEDDLIARLSRQGILEVAISGAKALKANVRAQIEALNSRMMGKSYVFPDDVWEDFWSKYVANSSDEFIDRARKLHREDGMWSYTDATTGLPVNIYIVDKRHIENNSVQVMHQYLPSEGTHGNRYDVTLLVNGIPMVHIELKRRGVALKEAFNQICRYNRESFWADGKLFDWVQVFVISNGSRTRYFSNTTYDTHMRNLESAVRSMSRSAWEYAITWTDAKNEPINRLEDFAATFLAKRTLLSVLFKYCVFTEEKQLLAMRPYQICATERVCTRVACAVANPSLLGTIDAGGYVWHTTGSGKTLTSFKCAQLVSAMPGVDKVLFVVDRRDLDYQTLCEYNRFEDGAVNGSANSRELARGLADASRKIHVTTIQKLDCFMKACEKGDKKHPVFDKTVVFIFDECHRSQFGDMHKALVRKFRHYVMFGFTGTPIFAKNSSSANSADFRTTEQVFGDQLHTYTIVDAVEAGSVLRFNVDTVSTVRYVGEERHDKVQGLEVGNVVYNEERIKGISDYVVENFDKYAQTSSNYTLKYATYDRGRDGKVHGNTHRTSVSGFNAIFAADSIESARDYYTALRESSAEHGRDLRIALIYSFAVNGDSNTNEPVGQLDDEDMDVSRCKPSDREFLDSAIADYNRMFRANYSLDGTSGDGFENYYKDVSKRMKSRELDLLVVVNMFLTGFDAPCLNTLYVDKPLRMHGLIQAFSRTNRILDSVKACGNVVCFRDLSEELDEALSLFGDERACGIIKIPPYDELLDAYGKNVELLRDMYGTDGVPDVRGEEAKREFVGLWSEMMRQRNVLAIFPEFEVDDELSEDEVEEARGIYLDIYHEVRDRNRQLDDPSEDFVFELELIRHVEVGVDYILALVSKYHDANCRNQELRDKINRAVRSSDEWRDRQDLIDGFIEMMNGTDSVTLSAFTSYVESVRDAEFKALVEEERLDESKTRALLEKAWSRESLDSESSDVQALVPPVKKPAHMSGRDWFRLNMSVDGGGLFDAARRRIGEKLVLFFDRFFGVVSAP